MRKVDNRGFSMVELSLALLIMTIIVAASVRMINALTAQTQVNTQQYKIAMLANSVKSNAKLIMDAAGTVCTAITTAYANDGWGWRHALCQNTSPFPVYNITTNILTYRIDTANFGNTVNSILNNTGNYCPFVAETATTVTFNCSGLNITGIQYQTLMSGAANAATPGSNAAANTVDIFAPPHTNSTNADFLNFLDFPSAVFIQYKEVFSNVGSTISHYDMINAQTNVVNFAYKLDFTDLAFDRQKKTRDGLVNLTTALSTYASGTMVQEYENVAPNGLGNADTAFVPWVWQGLATTQAGSTVLCADSTTCSAIVSGTQWATAAQTSTFAKAWLLVTTNLLSSNTSYIADAFGNPLRIIVMANGCTGDVSACTPAGPAGSNPPPKAQGTYLTSMTTASYTPRPPYASLIVSPLCTGTSSYPDFCRWSVVYSN